MKNQAIIVIIYTYVVKNGEKIMSRMKTFLKYALWIIGFFIFSEIVIYIGINSSYKDIQRKDNTAQVQIAQAQATLVNGRIKGRITATIEDYLTGKYIRIEFYSKRDIRINIGRISPFIPIQQTP